MANDAMLADLERTQRLRRIQIWLDDVAGYASELGERAINGELQSVTDNEWVWNERGRLLEAAHVLLREIWLEGLHADR